MTDEIKTGLTEEKPVDFKKEDNMATELLPDEEQPAMKPNTKIRKRIPLKADPETLHITDPQEDMKGPISSIMQTIKEEGEASDVVSKEEANRKKDENT